MFSSRFPAETDPSPLARLIAEKRRSGADLLDLTESNPTRAGIVYPEEAILDGLRDPRSLVYDPQPFGLPHAREQVAALYDISPDRVILTASTSEAYSWLCKLLCNPGDEILAPRPSYPLFEFLASLESVVVKTYPLRYYREWFIDMHALAAQVTPRTKAVIVVNPNNPTGSYLKRHEWQELRSSCACRQIALISDEVFADYMLEPVPDRAMQPVGSHPQELVFTLNGLSKTVGLPQMKLGWIVVNGVSFLVQAALERLAIIADTYLSVGAPVQYGLPALLAARKPVQEQILRRCQCNLAWLREQVRGTALSLLRVEGGWNATLRVPETRSEEQWITSLLEERGVLVQPGYFYDFEAGAHLILSLLTPTEVFRNGLARLVSHISSG